LLYIYLLSAEITTHDAISRSSIAIFAALNFSSDRDPTILKNKYNMEKSLINASLSTENLTFRRGSSPVAFEVTVNNNSDQFANFQLEVSAAGENRSSRYSWYKLSPEVAAAQPHGSSTQFQVSIFDTPIPGFVGTLNLTVTIFSPQLRQQRRLLLRLKIEPDGGQTLLSVELPVRDFQVYPRNTIDIPVRLRNLSQQPVNTVLRFAGVDPVWLVGGAERRLLVDPGGQAEVRFQCQPPSVVQAPSQNYPFSIEAIGNNTLLAKGEGNLEVLPIGFVEFNTTPKHQIIPTKGRWLRLPDWKSKSATFELGFKNASNLKQQLNVLVQGRDWRKCTFQVNPQNANLNIGGITKVLLDVKTKRPWVGIGKTLLLEAKSELFDQRLGSTDPATQTLELEVLPIIPLWLQLAVLALLAALLAFLSQLPSVFHTRSVQSVRLSDDVLSVVSGSNDCTLRRWTINANLLTASLNPEGTYNTKPPVACGKRQQPKGLLAIPNASVQTLRFMPVGNKRVAAGLLNGVIQIWDVPGGKNIQELKDSKDLTGDKVFDLVYTLNSNYLFSGHGSGKVRVWSAPSANSNFNSDPEKVIDLQKELQKRFEVMALTLSPDEKTLVIAGKFKSFLLWKWNQSQSSNQPQGFILAQQTLEKLGVSAGQNDYVYGLAFAPSQEILATSDSDGWITIWNLKQCQSINSSPVTELNCQPLDRWEAGKGAVRSLAFNKDGSLLVSGGDDRRVMAWFLTPKYKLDKAKAAKGKTIYQSSKEIKSIDVKTTKEGTTIVSGGNDSQVNLNRL
jgi:WD40 repeat protein